MSRLIIKPSDESLLMRNAELRLMVERRGDELAKQSKALGRRKAENKRLEAENARLREQIMWLKKGDILHVITEQEYIDQQRHEREMQASIDALDDENTKLRELAKRSWKVAENLCRAFDGPCTDDGTTIYKPCPTGERDDECVYGLLQWELHELGIEVDL